MKKRTGLILGIILGCLVLVLTVVNAEAAITSTRTPSGASIVAPVSITVTADSFADFNPNPGDNFWDIEINGEQNTNCAFSFTSAGCSATGGVFFSSTTLSVTVIFPLPNGDYNEVFVCTGATNPFNECTGFADIEGDGGGIIFSVLGLDTQVISGIVSSLIAQLKDVAGDNLPIIFIVTALVGLAFLIYRIFRRMTLLRGIRRGITRARNRINSL